MRTCYAAVLCVALPAMFCKTGDAQVNVGGGGSGESMMHTAEPETDDDKMVDAARHGRFQEVRDLIAKGVDPNFFNDATVRTFSLLSPRFSVGELPPHCSLFCAPPLTGRSAPCRDRATRRSTGVRSTPMRRWRGCC